MEQLWILWAALACLVILLYLIWQNQSIGCSHPEYRDAQVPKAVSGLRIVQVSDVQSKRFGKNQRRLLRRLRKEKPDLLLFTGDLISRRRRDMEAAMELVSGAVELCPTVFAPGNHEAAFEEYAQLRERLQKANVTVLENESAVFEYNGEKLEIFGMTDPWFTGTELPQRMTKEQEKQAEERWQKALFELSRQRNGFCLLLSHRPEKITAYAQSGFPLVFCGHAHGGQIRLPGIGGVYAPHQGLFPKLTSGMHRRGKTAVVISRGLGNSVIPIRVMNRPELVCLTLEHRE